MEWTELKGYLQQWIIKQKYLVLILLLGICLMCIPAAEEPEDPTTTSPEMKQEDLQETLGTILSRVSGAGKVEVLLTQAEGEETLYQVNEDISSGDVRRDTVLVTDSNRDESGLIRKKNPPVYQGAVIVCQGADNAAVRLSIVQAVMSATGLTSDHITVLKMK